MANIATPQEIKNFLTWLKEERRKVNESAKVIGNNVDMLDQHYEKIIKEYTKTVYAGSLCDQFKAGQN